MAPGSAALVATAAQLGYAAGVFLLVPLGETLSHRPLVVGLLGLTGLGQLGAGAAPPLAPLVGVTTVVAPILGPMATGLVADDQRGAVSGALLSGSIGGMLLSRAFVSDKGSKQRGGCGGEDDGEQHGCPQRQGRSGDRHARGTLVEHEIVVLPKRLRYHEGG